MASQPELESPPIPRGGTGRVPLGPPLGPWAPGFPNILAENLMGSKPDGTPCATPSSLGRSWRTRFVGGALRVPVLHSGSGCRGARSVPAPSGLHPGSVWAGPAVRVLPWPPVSWLSLPLPLRAWSRMSSRPLTGPSRPCTTRPCGRAASTAWSSAGSSSEWGPSLGVAGRYPGQSRGACRGEWRCRRGEGPGLGAGRRGSILQGVREDWEREVTPRPSPLPRPPFLRQEADPPPEGDFVSPGPLRLQPGGHDPVHQ